MNKPIDTDSPVFDLWLSMQTDEEKDELIKILLKNKQMSYNIIETLVKKIDEVFIPALRQLGADISYISYMQGIMDSVKALVKDLK